MYRHTRFGIDSHRSARTLGKFARNILVIELNPGLSSTSGCLFDWVADKRTIYDGARHPAFARRRAAPCAEVRWGRPADLPPPPRAGEPFEFRLREAPDPALRAKLRPDWAKLLDLE